MLSLRHTFTTVFAPALDEIWLSQDAERFRVLRDGMWHNRRFSGSIRVDDVTYGRGQHYAHVFGRKGSRIGVVEFEGAGGRGMRMRLHGRDARILRSLGFTIGDDRIVEWQGIGDVARLVGG